MEPTLRSRIQWLFGPGVGVRRTVLWPRWFLLRALGLIYLSAFYSFAFQIHGLVGARGILPAAEYLRDVQAALPGLSRFWLVPTVFWLSASDALLAAVVGAGILASLLLTVNRWPRTAALACFVCFLSCISVLQEFSSYQSDGMLLEAGFITLFFVPRGARPRLGADDPPSRASYFMLQWEWFRIYFWSGVVKLASGDVQWRTLTAMDHYYENGPLPAWPGWYVQQFPHAYHAMTALLTLVIELGVVWGMFLPRRFRIACFLIVTPLQVGIIATANYAFLNYLVLVLGVLLLDDDALRLLNPRLTTPAPSSAERRSPVRTWAGAVMLSAVFYATIAPSIVPGDSLAALPARLLDPFRIANQYGLFANMTTARFEIEFQGSTDGQHWIAYPFRYKPQEITRRPGLFAPYQPRFEWNLWFASLGTWEQATWVVRAQARLLEGSPAVLRLFARDPFGGHPPTQVRTVLWQYWFTDRETKRATGAWWRRQELGLYTGVLTRSADGQMELQGAR